MQGNRGISPGNETAGKKSVLMVHIIIFTIDRECQLDLLWQSMDKYLKSAQYVKTIITETGKEFEIATKAQVSSDCEYTMFLPDDCMFTQEVDFETINKIFEENVVCFSLRLGDNISYDLPLSIRISPVKQRIYKTIFRLYEWKDNTGYYGYPMSIDGHIFRTKEISETINNLSFTNPNELETLLSRNPIKHDYMASFDKPCLVNLVLNRVQTTHLNNKSGNFTAAYLQARYNVGHRLDLDKIVKSVANAHACHIIPTILYWEGGNE